MSNRRITDFPSINGADIQELDLLTLVSVFEVDPTLRNKKITFTEFKQYLNSFYASLLPSSYLFSELPVGTLGKQVIVTDASAPSVGSPVTGGGSAKALCWYNGTTWTVIGI